MNTRMRKAITISVAAVGVSLILFASLRGHFQPGTTGQLGESLRQLAIVLLVLAAVIAAGVLYFLPAIIADKRNHPNKTAIAVLNVFLGCTFLGWVVALVWSVKK